MPLFDVSDPETGLKATLEGDSPPTEQELTEVFDTLDKRIRPSGQARIPAPGAEMHGRPLIEPLTEVPQAFPAQEQAQAEAQARMTRQPAFPPMTGNEIVAGGRQEPWLGDQPLPIGKEGTFLRGVTDITSAVAQNPEYLAALLNPATAAAVGIYFAPGVAKQFFEDIGKATQGDNEALGRAAAMGIPALVGGMRAGRSIVERLQFQTVLEKIHGANIDAMAGLGGGIRPAPTIAPEIEGVIPQTAQAIRESANIVQAPDRGELGAMRKAMRPTVPETPPEPQRDLSVIEELRQRGADTRRKVQAIFPHLKNEEAAALRDQAFPREKAPDNLSKADIQRVFGEQLAPEEPIIPERTPNATETRNLPENIQPERVGTDALGATAEAGVGNRVLREAPKSEETVTPETPVTPAEAVPTPTPPAKVETGGTPELNLPRALEIERKWNLSPAEAAAFNTAIDRFQADPGKWTTAAEGIQKEALRVGAATGVPLTRLGDLKLSAEIAETYARNVETPSKAAAKVESEVKAVAGTEGQRSAKEIKSDLVDKIQRAIDVAPLESEVAAKSSTALHGKTTVTPDSANTVTIDIPGDGVFTVRNTKEALEGLLKRAKKIPTSTEVKASIPRGAVESSGRAIYSSELAKKNAAEDAAKAVREESKGKARISLVDVINKSENEGIVARTEPTEDPELDYGTLWREFRIRKATPQETQENYLRNRVEVRWVGERRVVKFSKEKGRTEGEWYFDDSGKTRADVVRGMEANMPKDATIQDEGLAAWRDLENETGRYAFLSGKESPQSPGISVGPGAASPLSSPVTRPSPPSERPLGIVASSTPTFLTRLADAFWNPIKSAFSEFDLGAFMQRTLPKFTKADRDVGEAGARYAAAPMVGRKMGEQFADEVLEGSDVDNRDFGVALKEDNLRGIKANYRRKADEAMVKAQQNPNAQEVYLDDAAMYHNAANSVVTFIGARNSPFRTEGEYQAFLAKPETQAAIERYKQLHEEQKEPLFREAANIDPDTELPGRGLQTGTHINLTFTKEGEAGGITPRSTGGDVRQLGTLLRRDPFARRATGTGESYEAGFKETMASAFEQEYPVAAQHEFIRKMIEKGIAQVGEKAKPPEGMKAYLLRLKPWTGKFLYLPKELAGEYEPLVGLKPGVKIPIYTPTAQILTRQSIMGLGEGTAHSANILLKLFTGITTDKPAFEAFISAMPGRPDAWLAVGRALIRGLRPDSKAMLELAKINAAKVEYSGLISSRFLNPLDKGVRLLSNDVYNGLVERGLVEPTETGKREFVNEIGNYTTSVQSWLVRNLRTSGVQPFATGFRTAKVQAVKRLFLGTGLEGTSWKADAALRTAIAAKFVGTALTIGTIRYLLTQAGVRKPDSETKIGSVAWQDKDGQTHEFDLAGLLGATTGARAIGVMGTAEMLSRGLDKGTALKTGAKSVATTVTSQFAGPGVRFSSVALTGKDPYGYQVASVAPPTEDVFKSQAARNIGAALQSVNPLVDVALSRQEGKTWDEIRQRQLTRYAAKTPSGVQTSSEFANIVTRANLNEYADWLASRARKLNMAERHEFIIERLDKDGVEGQDRMQVINEMKKKGTFKFQ